MTRNRESVILTNALKAAAELGLGLAILPEDQHPQLHQVLNRGLHSALIVIEEIRQQWDKERGQ